MDKRVMRQELKVALVNGSAMLGAYVLKRTTEKILESVFQKEPPKEPDEEEHIGWIEALGWAAFTGAMAGALKLVIKRGTHKTLDKII